MNTKTAQEIRDDYLRRLDAAISEIPHGLAVELRAGIAEELSGADPDALASRILELGSPEEVAQAAIEAGFGGPQGSVPTPFATPAPAPLPDLTQTPGATTAQSHDELPLTESRGFAITAAIILGAGGIIIPFVGWIVGVILVANSKLWARGEKLWAILFPPAALAATLLVATLLDFVTSEPSNSAEGSVYPDASDFQSNPLVPAAYDIVWSVMLMGVVVAPFTALWLVLRLRGRTRPKVTN